MKPPLLAAGLAAAAALALLLPVGLNAWDDLGARRALRARLDAHRAAATRALTDGAPHDAVLALEAAQRLAPLDSQVATELLRARAEVITARPEVIAADGARPLAHELTLALDQGVRPVEPHRVALGEVLAALGDEAAAETHLRAAADAADASPRARVALGRHLVRTGRAAEAIPLLEAAVAADGTDPRARYTLGMAFRALEKWDEAVVALRRSADQGNDARAWFELGDTLLRVNRPEEALQALNRAAAHPAARNALPGLHTRLGVAAFRAGQYPAALDHLRTAMRTDPTSDARQNLAVVYEALGDHGRAATLLDELITADPFRADLYPRLITALHRLNRVKAAIAVGERFEAVAKVTPGLEEELARVQTLVARVRSAADIAAHVAEEDAAN